MIIDVPYLLLLLFALYKGFTKGFIIAVFSVIGVVVGLAAAIKLSAVVANHLKTFTHIQAAWLPFLSFLIVMIATLALVKLLATVLQKSVELMLMGWANKLGGVLLFMLLYTMVYSVILFFAVKLDVVTNEATVTSKTYGFVRPWASITFDGVSKLFPIFKNMFTDLEQYFDTIAAGRRNT